MALQDKIGREEIVDKICEDVHPEHKSSIDWLNENTNDNINFYVFFSLFIVFI